MREVLLAPPGPDWATFTSLRKAATDRPWLPFTGFSSGASAEVVNGIAVDAPYLVANYETGSQEPAPEPITRTVIHGTSYGLAAQAQEAFPPTWDGNTSSGRTMVVGSVPANDGTDSPPVNNSTLNTVKVSFHIPGHLEGITSVKLRVSGNRTGTGWMNSTTAASLYSNGTFPRSFICSQGGWTEHWDEPSYNGADEPWTVETWAGEWAGGHFSVSPSDHKHPISGSAFSGAPVATDDFYAAYENDGGSVLIPLSGWSSNVVPGESASINMGISDPLPEWINYGTWQGGVTPTDAAMTLACSGNVLTPVAQPALSGFRGGFALGSGMQLVIEHDPIPQEPSGDPEMDERGVVYFDLTEAPQGETPTSASLLFFGVYAFTSDPDARAYIVPIDPTDPSQEGPMPITIARHHPVGVEDKIDRAIWDAVVDELTLTEPTLFEVELDPAFLSGLDEIGFQFAIMPALSDPWEYTGLGIFTDISAGGPGSPYTGPRLRLLYDDEEDPQPLPDIAISATARLGIGGPLLRVGGLAESPVDRPILSHAARRRRGW